jgi:hypothetical protein
MAPRPTCTHLLGCGLEDDLRAAAPTGLQVHDGTERPLNLLGLLSGKEVRGILTRGGNRAGTEELVAGNTAKRFGFAGWL